MPTTAPAPISAAGTGGVATKVGSYDTSTFKDAPAGSYEAQLYKSSQSDAPSATTPPLIVTSGQSRSTYATNVNQMNGAVSNFQTKANNDPSVVNYLTQNKMPSDFNSRAAMAKQYGIEGYTGSSAQNTQLLSILQNSGKTTDTGTSPSTDVTPPAPTAGTNENATGTGATPTPTSNPDGTTSADQNSGLDPVLKKQYDDALVGLDQQISDAKSTLDDAKATLANDPASSAAVDMIMSKYDQQIELMKAKNNMILGNYTKNSARTGMMQYAGDMNTNFMSEEQDKASQRVANLITTEMQMVMKTQAAYKSGDVKAFSAASKAYQDATKAKTEAISKLLTETDKVVKERQAQAKIDATAAKQKITDDIRISSSLGKTVADTLKASGVTDKKSIDDYIDSFATSSGISNPDMLRSAVVKAQQEQSKLDLSSKKADESIKNTENSIKNRDARTVIASQKKSGSSKNGSSTFKVSPAIAAVTPQMESVKGTDGYIDPEKWVSARTTWNTLGGTDSSFNSNFKKYLNPASYDKAGFKGSKTTTSQIPQ